MPEWFERVSMSQVGWYWLLPVEPMRTLQRPTLTVVMLSLLGKHTRCCGDHSKQAEEGWAESRYLGRRTGRRSKNFKPDDRPINSKSDKVQNTR